MTRKKTPARTVLSLSALALIVTGAVLFAGPLDPPAGPVTSTYKTLTEVEPRTAINAANTPGDADSLFKITQPGSYYLTGNIAGVAAKHGIEIAVGGVTLDLMGFDLSGISVRGTFDGVSVTVANLTNIAVRNGSIRGWGDDGVDLGTFNATNSAVVDVHASGNLSNGITIGTGCTVTGCSASGNTANGISTNTGCTISGCSALNNGANGISAAQVCTITGCSAVQNAAHGILTNDGCTITACVASFNTGNGISTSVGCTITGCSAHLNTASGISTGTGCTITGCSAYQNTASGISTSTSCTISNCTARFNVLDGIVVSSGCLVLANTCASNGNVGDGAGIHATGSDNRIEGNNCTRADRGIDMDFAGNIIIKNTCSGNTINWTIAASNYYGPIIDRAGILTAGVNGPAAAGTLATSDPHANFTY